MSLVGVRTYENILRPNQNPTLAGMDPLPICIHASVHSQGVLGCPGVGVAYKNTLVESTWGKIPKYLKKTKRHYHIVSAAKDKCHHGC